MPRNRWPSRPLEDRFWEKVDKTTNPDGCWVWTGAVTAPGQHGRIWVASEGRKVIASRVSWEMHFGPIPAGHEVCHTCDNPPCVYPGHLFLGTHRVNMQDASAKGRTGPQIADWTLCRNGHVLAVTGYTSPSTGRRRCRACSRESRRRRHASWSAEERRARRYVGKTPAAMSAAADKLGEAMG